MTPCTELPCTGLKPPRISRSAAHLAAYGPPSAAAAAAWLIDGLGGCNPERPVLGRVPPTVCCVAHGVLRRMAFQTAGAGQSRLNSPAPGLNPPPISHSAAHLAAYGPPSAMVLEMSSEYSRYTWRGWSGRSVGRLVGWLVGRSSQLGALGGEGDGFGRHPGRGPATSPPANVTRGFATRV